MSPPLRTRSIAWTYGRKLGKRSLRRSTSGAFSKHLNDRPRGLETGAAGCLPDGLRGPVIIQMRGGLACVANEEDAIVIAAGMAIGQERIPAFNPQGEVACNEQIKNA